MVDFGALPPEINSARMYAGPGSASLVAAAQMWDSVASDLFSAASAFQSVVPDVWTAFAGSLPTATAVLGRWPDIRLLAGAPTRNWRRSTTG